MEQGLQLSWSEMTAADILYSLGYGDVADPRLTASERLQVVLDAIRERERRNHGVGDDHLRK